MGLIYFLNAVKFIHPTKKFSNPCLARDYVKQIGGFDEVIDVRSPAEFEEDHVPGASEYCCASLINLQTNQSLYLFAVKHNSLNNISVNLPVLDNAQRAEVGTLHNSRVKWHIVE